MNPIEQFEAEFRNDDPYQPLHDHLAANDDRMLEELVAMRKKKGLSQDTVAARMNRSKTSVSNFERLGSDPHLSTIRRYAAAIGAKVTTRVVDFDKVMFEFDDGTVEVRVARQKERRSEHPAHSSEDVVVGLWAPI